VVRLRPAGFRLRLCFLGSLLFAVVTNHIEGDVQGRRFACGFFGLGSVRQGPVAQGGACPELRLFTCLSGIQAKPTSARGRRSGETPALRYGSCFPHLSEAR
jgi:hypothetical protein